MDISSVLNSIIHGNLFLIAVVFLNFIIIYKFVLGNRRIDVGSGEFMIALALSIASSVFFFSVFPVFQESAGIFSNMTLNQHETSEQTHAVIEEEYVPINATKIEPSKLNNISYRLNIDDNFDELII